MIAFQNVLIFHTFIDYSESENESDNEPEDFPNAQRAISLANSEMLDEFDDESLQESIGDPTTHRLTSSSNSMFKATTKAGDLNNTNTCDQFDNSMPDFLPDGKDLWKESLGTPLCWKRVTSNIIEKGNWFRLDSTIYNLPNYMSKYSINMQSHPKYSSANDLNQFLYVFDLVKNTGEGNVSHAESVFLKSSKTFADYVVLETFHMKTGKHCGKLLQAIINFARSSVCFRRPYISYIRYDHCDEADKIVEPYFTKLVRLELWSWNSVEKCYMYKL